MDGAVCNVRCAVCSVHCTLGSVWSSVCSLQWSAVQYLEQYSTAHRTLLRVEFEGRPISGVHVSLVVDDEKVHEERPLGLFHGRAGAQGAGEGALLALVIHRLGNPVPEHHCTLYIRHMAMLHIHIVVGCI